MQLFLSADFTLRDPTTFEAVLLEPGEGEIDRTVSDAELRRLFAGSIASSSRPSLSRAPSSSSVMSSQSSLVSNLTLISHHTTPADPNC